MQSITRPFALPTLNWSQQATCFAFGVLLILVILICAVSPSPFLAIALIAILVVAVLAVRFPPMALLLVFLGAGFPTLLLPLPGHTLHMVEPPLLLCLFICIFQRTHLRLRLPHLLALLFLSMAVISFIHVPDVSTSITIPGASKELVELTGIFLAFFCGTALAKYVKNPSFFLNLALLTNIPLYLIGLAQALNIHVPALLEDSSAQNPKESLGRLWGSSSWPSSFGMYLINLYAIALACFLLGTRKRDRILGAIMTGGTGLEIIGSGTISVATAAIILTVIAFIVTRRVKWLLGILAVAAVIAAFSLGKLLPRFMHNDTSNRLILWQESIKLIAAHPLFGIGLYQFPRYMTQNITSLESGLAAGKLEPLEQYLEWAVESGIVWGIVGALLLLSITYSCWKAYRLARPTYQAVLLAATLAMIANIYIGFVDVPFDQVEGPILLCLLAGLALGYAEYIRWGNPEQQTNGYRSPPLKPRSNYSTVPGGKPAGARTRQPGANSPAPAQPFQSASGGSAAPITAPLSPERTGNVHPDVSIIVPATRAAKASRTLASVFDLCYEGKMEIIVVGPVVDELAHLWADKPAQGWTVIPIFHELTRPAGKLRNLGANQATGEVLLFLDDDITVAQDWVKRSVRALQEPKVG
ncbi:MAG TPA: O-antigen ligase family protein, partial [Ktedonobacteraceae bacterium]